MAKDEVFSKLKRFGYARAENYGQQIQHKAIPTQDFRGKSLNHTILEFVTIKDKDFTEACATGSIFRNCTFVDCILDQADFEFCEFYDCDFSGNSPINCSFNNSSFFYTTFHDIVFRGCTFTSCVFHACYWDGGNIVNSTLEGALFRQCRFQGMDLRQLNMDFVEFEEVTLQDVILPLDQIPFIFGALQYLLSTDNNVKISKKDTETITVQKYIKEIIPLLCSHFCNTEQYFPLANIYYALGKYDEGLDATKKGLMAAMSLKDFRMLKYFCKLIAYSKVFKPGVLHDLYNNYICRLLPQNKDGIVIPNYARQLLEIKELLFNTSNTPSFRISLKTNIGLSDNQKLGKLLESIFAVGKQHDTFCANDIKVVLQQNSPLIITLCVTGEDLALTSLLMAYLSLAGISLEQISAMPSYPKQTFLLPEHSRCMQELNRMAETYRQELRKISVYVSLIEYYIENLAVCEANNGPLYFFNAAENIRINSLTT